jgi:hypothetical protein
MIGLIAFIVLGGLLALAIWAFLWTHKTMLGNGKSGAVATAWAFGAVIALSLPITWDAIPTWIAFKYYAHKESGLTVFKTLEQWKVENPGVAETLEPYGFKDKRGELKNLGNNKFRHPLNDRFAYDSSKVDLFLSVQAVQYTLIDQKNESVLVRHTRVVSGNSGGFATGGTGWWAFWLIHKTPDAVSSGFFGYVESVKTLEVRR